MCILCKIISREIPTDFLYEDELVVAIRDKNPIAPVHVLVIPKKHIASINEIEAEDERTMGRLIIAAKKIAVELGIAERGYKLLVRTGEHGGQEIQHVHLHLLGGARLKEEIRPL